MYMHKLDILTLGSGYDSGDCTANTLPSVAAFLTLRLRAHIIRKYTIIYTNNLSECFHYCLENAFQEGSRGLLDPSKAS